MVSHNEFDFDPASIGRSCTVANACGFQGIFSEFGTFPAWSPFQGTTVEEHITFGQNNHFSQNAYSGPWRFMAPRRGHGDLGSMAGKPVPPGRGQHYGPRHSPGLTRFPAQL